MTEAKFPSFAFADGVLHVSIPLSKMRLQWKPRPLAEELYVGRRKWQRFWPEFRILHPPEEQKRKPARVVDIHLDASAKELARQKDMAFDAFRQEIEPEIVRIAEPFGSHQWALMTFMHEDEWAMDLARGNPVLAYALANNSLFRRTPTDVAAVQARWHCHRKQRELLEWLGFPGTNKVARLLREIPPEAVSPAILQRLAHAVKSDKRVMELLAHLPRITAAALDLATTLKFLDLITPKLLKEVSEKPEVHGEAAVGDIILQGLLVMEMMRSKSTPKPFTSMAQVVRFREEAETELTAYRQRQEVAREQARRATAAGRARRRRQDAKLHQEACARALGQATRINSTTTRFPSPPLPGTQNIVPLTSAKQMQEESNEQHHCVWSYADRVKGGNFYVYKILAPERATLSICRGPWGWQIAELKADHNRSVSSITVGVVERWLEEFRRQASGECKS